MEYLLDLGRYRKDGTTHTSGAGSSAGLVRYAFWSPDGTRILYERNDWTSNIYVADLEMR
jgi:Tol biopolymer transport system component